MVALPDEVQGAIAESAEIRELSAPVRVDSKRWRKLRQKKTALGHAEDDHEDWTMEQKM